MFSFHCIQITLQSFIYFCKSWFFNFTKFSKFTMNWESISSVGSSHWRCSVKKMLLEISQNSQENTCARASFLMTLQASICNFIKKETLAQEFSCKFCKISKIYHFLQKKHCEIPFFAEHLWASASVVLRKNYFGKIEQLFAHALKIIVIPLNLSRSC